jgi:hypothetical protein
MTNLTEIEEITHDDALLTAGGDHVETGLGIVWGIAFAAGFYGSGGLVGLAFVAGAGVVAWDLL